jgi:hypothetical protein
MKKIVFFSVVAALAMSMNLQAGDSGLIAKWLLDEGQGTIAKDISGSNTMDKSNIKWGDGIKGKGLVFKGNNAAVVNNNASLMPDEISFSAWIKPAEKIDKDNEKINVIFFKGQTGSGTKGVNFWLHSGGVLFFYIGSDKNEESSFSWYATQQAVVLEKDVWYHVVATHSVNSSKIYLNGELVKESVHASPVKLAWDEGMNLALGGYPGATGMDFRGTIDEPAVYNRALTAEEVLNLYREHTASAPE